MKNSNELPNPNFNLNKFKELIYEINKIDKNIMSIDEINLKVNSLYNEKIGYIPTMIQKSCQKTYPYKFFRFRVLKETELINERLFSEFSHPPVCFTNDFSRVNIPHFPVLYCSSNPKTALEEIKTKDIKSNKIQVMYLSEWKLKYNVKVNVSSFLFHGLKNDSIFKPTADIISEKLFDNFKHYPLEITNNYIQLYFELCKVFVENSDYLLSSYIGHKYLYAEHKLNTEMFLYPSIRTKGISLNCAVHPNIIMNKFVLNRIYKIVSKPTSENKFQLNIVKFGKPEKSIIIWNNAKDVNSKTKLKFDKLFEDELFF